MIAVLSGGTGGSKMVDGLARVVGQANLTAIVNTADDGDFYGLRVCPDLDICTYVLAGVIDARGWGYADDSFSCLEGLETLGLPAWFGLGDRDLATHIYRTLRIEQGAELHEITQEICDRLGVEARVLPMCNAPVHTSIVTENGPRTFQEYLVKHGAREDIVSLSMEGIHKAHAAPGVIEAINAAETIVIAPSSPIVSIGTILAVPGVREALVSRREDCVAISPIVGRAPVEGPAHKFLAGAGYSDCSAAQMAEIYSDVAGTFILHDTDVQNEGRRIVRAGVRPVGLDVLMPDVASRERLAREVLESLGRAQ